MLPLSRRRLLMLAGLTGLTGLTSATATAARAADNPVAAVYREALHLHTRWVQEQWDDTIGAYAAADFRFTAVLGNAVLLGLDDYDPRLTGVAAPVLRARTIATIRRFAATNRLAGGTGWGRRLFWDSTFELYFLLAARLLWADLDDATRAAVTKIATGQAAYAYELGAGDDPLSTGSTTNGTAGGRPGDSKLVEMGAYAQALAPGIAWAGAGDPAAEWRERFLLWTANASGLPAADRANPALIDGDRIDQLVTAHNLDDTFAVRRDELVNPFHQSELWRTAGRSAIHFLVAGQPLPPVLTRRPNGDELWRTLRLLAGDAGEPVMPMAADHYHAYGRDVLPLAFLAQVHGDRHAARAEADLAERLLPYQRHEPANRLLKFGGAESDEPQARAELAIAYLFHRLRAEPVRPVSRQRFFADARGTRDFGADAGLTVHQSPAAFAAAVTRPGFVRFLWQPGHDNWLVDTRASAFLPAGLTPSWSWTRAWQKNRDGVDATATVLGSGDGYAGFTTLPTGTVVYASTGLPGEGGLTLFALTMPGVPGLDGARTFTHSGGRVELADQITGDIDFAPRPARYVRMLGREPATENGYSLFSFGVLDVHGADLAQGAMPIVSSEDGWNPARHATDGNPETRWAVSPQEQGRADSWLAVDLGSAVTVAGVRIAWEASYAKKFVIQTSTDALTWTDVAVVPQTRTASRWVGIDGRAGLVTHGGKGRITVTATEVRAPAPIVEGYPGTGRDLARLAARRLPSAPGLLVSDAEEHLSVFNLTSEPAVDVPVRLPSRRRLYVGEQVVTEQGLEWRVSLERGTALVEPPRFILTGEPAIGTVCTVRDSHRVTVTAPQGRRTVVTLRCGVWTATVRVMAGKSRTVTVPDVPITPAADLSRGRTTFPVAPLPEGMSSPEHAVDGDPRTAWRPGPAGRMVVDLGAPHAVRDVRLTWSAAGRRRPHRVEASTDGLEYVPLGAEVRYVALVIDGWQPGDAEVVEFAVI
ncbi:discoidin domain-containing protein [Actinoplanes sp. NPDC051494]|uniref:discoidin domain-containing protein n=1 Tax=Actinoplanes sp. NPDC051494 TaxID=3363907 RepID=UPI0037A15CBD